MFKASLVLLLLALAGCTGLPVTPPRGDGPCATQGEHSYACQIQRYHDVAA